MVEELEQGGKEWRGGRGKCVGRLNWCGRDVRKKEGICESV